MKRIALFPGSFDPFTVGHASLVTRGLALVDELIIAIGINVKKAPCFPLDRRLEALRALYAHEPRVRVETYDNLTTDFEYEKAIADVNRTLTGIETLLLFTEPAYASVSSSVVRELHHYGKDITPFLPEGMQL